MRKEGHGPCDENDANQRQDACELLLSRKDFALYDQGAGVAAQDGCKECQDGGFGERKVDQRVVQPEYPKEPSHTADDQ